MPIEKRGSIRALPSDARTIGAGQFKATCLELMDEVKERHLQVVVTKRGVPYARLIPVEPTSPSPFGFLRNTVVDQHDVVAPDPAAWAGSDADPLGER